MPLHVAFFNRSFYPDTAATGQLLSDLCEGLARDHGCRVSVVAGVPLLPAVAEAAVLRRGLLFNRERYRGVEILRAKGTRFSKRWFPGRFANYVTYFLSACWAGLRLDHPDVVVALTDPPVIGLAAYAASRRFRAPLVMSYRDIFPEAARLLEDFRSEAVNRVLRQVNRFLVRKAERVVALGETMRRRLIEGKGALPEKTLVIPDWADCSEITPGPKDNPFARAHELVDKFVVMHSGNLGLSQNLDVLLQTAEKLRPHPDILFVIVGEGVKRSSLEAWARERALSNVRFLPYQPQQNLANSFAAADVFVVSLKKGLSGYIVPSKVYGILAAGRPFIAATEEDCEAAIIARRHDCGIVTEPGNPSVLAEGILTFYRDRELARRMGENARRAAAHFGRPIAVQAYYDLLCQLTR